MSDGVGAEGAHTFGWNSQPPTVDGYKPADSNIVQNLDVTKVATDGDGPGSNDHDYDDPYPGGGSAYTLLPSS